MANKDTAKPWFNTGKYPTQAQFYQLFEWLRWKDEEIAIADVTGLQDIINDLPAPANGVNPVSTFGLSADGSKTIPAGGILTQIIVDSDVDMVLNIGNAAGGNDIIADLAITGGVPMPITVVVYAKGADRDIFFSGITQATNFIIITQTLPQ